MKNKAMKAEFAAQMKLQGLLPLVSVDLRIEGSDSVRVEALWSEVERGQGHARRALQLLARLADRHGVQLKLVPHFLAYEVEQYPEDQQDHLHALNEQKLSNAQLEAWYGRYGFIRTGQQEFDDPVMVREPQALGHLLGQKPKGASRPGV